MKSPALAKKQLSLWEWTFHFWQENRVTTAKLSCEWVSGRHIWTCNEYTVAEPPFATGLQNKHQSVGNYQLCWVENTRPKKKRKESTRSPSPMKQKSPAEIPSPRNVEHHWILTRVQVQNPTPGKSSRQSHLNKVQRKTEVRPETEFGHSQNLAFP